MKCPLIKKQVKVELGEVWDEPLMCLKEECAWWDEEDGRCAILSLMGDIRVISEAARNIALKMPHEEQFRK